MREHVRDLVAGAQASIEAHRRHIDDLNVYPVPDGDTGTNLTLTVRAVADALAGAGADDRAGLAREVARAALMGARGNSGVILSQIVRGATDSLAESDDLGRAFRSASDAAYRPIGDSDSAAPSSSAQRAASSAPGQSPARTSAFIAPIGRPQLPGGASAMLSR